MVFCLSMNVIGQKTNLAITNENVRFALATGMSNFVTSVKQFYYKGQSQKAFVSKVLGTTTPTNEGNLVLVKAYSFLLEGTSPDMIIKTYNGKEIAGAIRSLKLIYDKSPNLDGAEIFGLNSSIENRESAAAECRWYQIWCHLKNFAGWVVDNWPKIEPIIIFLISVF